MKVCSDGCKPSEHTFHNIQEKGFNRASKILQIVHNKSFVLSVLHFPAKGVKNLYSDIHLSMRGIAAALLFYHLPGGMHHSVVWSHDGIHIASAGEDKQVQVWLMLPGKSSSSFF